MNAVLFRSRLISGWTRRARWAATGPPTDPAPMACAAARLSAWPSSRSAPKSSARIGVRSDQSGEWAPSLCNILGVRRNHARYDPRNTKPAGLRLAVFASPAVTASGRSLVTLPTSLAPKGSCRLALRVPSCPLPFYRSEHPKVAVYCALAQASPPPIGFAYGASFLAIWSRFRSTSCKPPRLPPTRAVRAKEKIVATPR